MSRLRRLSDCWFGDIRRMGWGWRLMVVGTVADAARIDIVTGGWVFEDIGFPKEVWRELWRI